MWWTSAIDLNRASTRGRPETSGMTRVDRVKSNTGITQDISGNNK
jgi:malate/lactate dehydrogenase